MTEFTQPSRFTAREFFQVLGVTVVTVGLLAAVVVFGGV